MPILPYQYENLYGQELQDAIAEKALAWIPLGILERHGEHLPYGLDGFKAHGICMRLARRFGGVVLPPNHFAGVHAPWYGDDLERYQKMRREVGDFYLRPETFKMLLEDVLEGLINLGFTTLVLYTGHYPGLQRNLMNEVAKSYDDRPEARVIAFSELLSMDGPGDHAGITETSFYIALDGEFRRDAVKPEHAGKIGFYGIHGPPPTEATRELGEMLLAQVEAYFEALGLDSKS